MLTIREEPISDIFTLFHVEGMPVPVKFHRFTDADLSAPHCHPVDFWSTVLVGSYVERVYGICPDGSSIKMDFHRKKGDRFFVKAEHIHQIVSLPDGECWTMTEPGPIRRKWGTWNFDNGKAIFTEAKQ